MAPPSCGAFVICAVVSSFSELGDRGARDECGETPQRKSDQISQSTATVRKVPRTRNRREEDTDRRPGEDHHSRNPAEPQREVEVFEDRPVGESADAREQIAPHELRLVAERDEESSRSPVHQPFAQSEQRRGRLEAQRERAARRSNVDGRADRLAGPRRETNVRMQEEEDVPGGGGGAALELSPTPRRALDDPGSRRAGERDRVVRSAVGDDSASPSASSSPNLWRRVGASSTAEQRPRDDVASPGSGC